MSDQFRIAETALFDDSDLVFLIFDDIINKKIASIDIEQYPMKCDYKNDGKR